LREAEGEREGGREREREEGGGKKREREMLGFRVQSLYRERECRFT